MADEAGTPVAKKLAILLPHLIQHNAEHAEDLEKWIVEAGEGGCRDAAKEMKKAQALMMKIGDHLECAAGSIGAGPEHPREYHHEDGHNHDGAHGHSHHHSHDHHHHDHD